jgi:hypothetical protein
MDKTTEFLQIAQQFRLGHLTTEAPHHLTKEMSHLAVNDLASALHVLHQVDILALRSLERVLPALWELHQKVAATFKRGNDVLLVGCGATGRLSLVIETLSLQEKRYTGRVRAFMAGGDYALVKSVERFEDRTHYGARQLHDLGFAVEEVAITIDGDTQMISFQPKLVAAGYHSQRLRDLTGLNAEELQAKRLLASFDRYNARENKLGLSIHEMAKKWISEVFEPVISRVPEELRGRVERAQMFHEILENRWYLSEKAGYDVGLEEATDNYCNEILPMRRDSGVDIVVQ